MRNVKEQGEEEGGELDRSQVLLPTISLSITSLQSVRVDQKQGEEAREEQKHVVVFQTKGNLFPLVVAISNA